VVVTTRVASAKTAQGMEIMDEFLKSPHTRTEYYYDTRSQS